MIRKNYTIRASTHSVLDHVLEEYRVKKSPFVKRCIFRLSVNPTPKEQTFFNKHFGKCRRDPGFGGSLIPIYWDAMELKHLERIMKVYSCTNASAMIEYAIIRSPYWQDAAKKVSMDHRKLKKQQKEMDLKFAESEVERASAMT